VGMSGVILSNIDAIANKAIDSKMTPGIQVLVAKRKSYFSKSYGFHTYDKAIKVKDSDIYDLASLTKKIAASCQM
jgi:CubicO group peptidase (beta-lactamase class C family)